MILFRQEYNIKIEYLYSKFQQKKEALPTPCADNASVENCSYYVEKFRSKSINKIGACYSKVWVRYTRSDWCKI